MECSLKMVKNEGRKPILISEWLEILFSVTRPSWYPLGKGDRSADTNSS